eukprot:CAMPEP_0176152452 /NCGR_PEP_ID=MMETSP0120_2-20121206/77863_1 /TAXON_ID=160619 /ORGANISM="Kryptoperidinium foliaceum, Strain CCMP 1326" /LENGTH=93 /DNA_ID=CAMNT_0017489459 /DNA_START=18 /DNA_END=296 /DNA_ORIENTATION=-
MTSHRSDRQVAKDTVQPTTIGSFSSRSVSPTMSLNNVLDTPASSSDSECGIAIGPSRRPRSGDLVSFYKAEAEYTQRELMAVRSKLAMHQSAA